MSSYLQRKIGAWQESQSKKRATRRKEAQEGDVNRLTASDDIEKEYGYRSGTEFHKSFIERLKSMKFVSSPTATNRVANISIWFALAVKVISILISYGVIDYIYQNSIKANYNLPDWFITIIIFTLATALEFVSSMFMKNIMNASESPITRGTTFVLGLAITILITYSHVVYTDLKNTVNANSNKQIVMTISTPTIDTLKSQIESKSESISGLKKTLSDREDRYNQNLKDIDAIAEPYRTKAEKYQKMVDESTAKKQKYLSVLGKNQLTSKVQSWANRNNELYKKEIAKKNKLTAPTNPQIEKYKEQKVLLENELNAEYIKENKNLDSQSYEKGDVNLWLQILISFLAKIDLYGYFVLRLNIKNKVMDSMHKIIDEFNVINQLSGVLQQFSNQTGQVMKAIGLTGLKVSNELASINSTIVTTGNRQLQSNIRLINALQDSTPLPQMPYDMNSIAANYQKTGDERIDVGEKEKMNYDRADKEKILTAYVQGLGYPHIVMLDESVEQGNKGI